PSSVLLFTMRDGARVPIRRKVNGSSETAGFVIGSDDRAEKLSKDELLDRIQTKPENFSPNVLSRGPVQDYLLPTLAYAGGPAEVAYFAQAGAVYEALLGRVTPIVPRFSATIVEPKVQRWLRQYGITAADAFEDPAALRQKLGLRTLPEGLQAAFENVQRTVENSLAQLRKSLEQLDPTLKAA